MNLNRLMVSPPISQRRHDGWLVRNANGWSRVVRTAVLSQDTQILPQFLNKFTKLTRGTIWPPDVKNSDRGGQENRESLQEGVITAWWLTGRPFRRKVNK